ARCAPARPRRIAAAPLIWNGFSCGPVEAGGPAAVISQAPAPLSELLLQDRSQKNFGSPVSVLDVAASIGAGLARAALAGRVNGKLVDTSFLIKDDAQLAIVTEKDPAALEIIR